MIVWTINKKLALMILAGGIFMFGITATGYWAVCDLERTNTDLTSRMELLRVHLEADMAHDAIRADVLDAILIGVDKTESVAGTAATFAVREKNLKEDFRRHAKIVQDDIARLAVSNAGANSNGSRTDEDLESYITYAATLIDDGLADPHYARTRLVGFLDLFGVLEKSMAAVSADIKSRANQTKHEAEANAQRNKVILVGAALVAAIIGLAFGFGVARSITRPLAQAVRVAKAVAAGDLTQNIVVKGKDEIGHLMQCFADMNCALNDKITHLSDEIYASSRAIFEASSKLVACSSSLSERTEVQASTVEETAASVEQISAAIKQNADNAAEARRMAELASHVADNGNEATAKLMNTMGQIHIRSVQILDIASVMDGIAFQTNILALNAAIEAARAGEQGRAFSVVAAEVRNLASRSAASAKDVKALIEGTVLEIEAGSKVAAAASHTVRDNVENSRAVTRLMSEIAITSREQSDGVEQIAVGITHIERASEKNADLAQESAAMAELLAQHATHLIALLKVFKIDHAAPVAFTRLTQVGVPGTGPYALAGVTSTGFEEIQTTHTN